MQIQLNMFRRFREMLVSYGVIFAPYPAYLG